jgi:hypothetical protein
MVTWYLPTSRTTIQVFDDVGVVRVLVTPDGLVASSGDDGGHQDAKHQAAEQQHRL